MFGAEGSPVMASSAYGAKQAAAGHRKPEKIVFGSDDEFDDLEDENIASNNASRDGVDEDGDYSIVSVEHFSSNQTNRTAAAEEFQRAMEQSPGVLEGIAPGLHVTDNTGGLSLEDIMEAKTTNRSRTTMERFSATSHQRHGTYSTRTTTLQDDIPTYNAADEPDGTIQGFLNVSPRQGQPHSTRSTQRKSSQRTVSLYEDGLPSSREIFAAGSKDLQVDSPERSFKTQTTVPFTLPEQTQGSSMIMVPPADAQSSQGQTRAIIDDITEYLRQDIAGAEKLQHKVSGDLPSTEPNSAHDATISNHDKANSDTGQESQETSKNKQKKRSQKDDTAFESDDPDIGVPKEMYMPRPSRSRAKRAADDLDLHSSFKLSQASDKDDRAVKRRKTEGDSLDRASDFEKPTRRTKKLELEEGGAQDFLLEKDDTEDVIETNPIKEQTILEKDNESQEEYAEPKLPAKRKRGRPKKTSRKAQETTKADEIDETTIEEEESVQVRSIKGRRTGRGRNQTEVPEESEDELAGNQPDKNSSDVQDTIVVEEGKQPTEQTDDDVVFVEKPPDKKPSKRGRKSKKNKNKKEPVEKDSGGGGDDDETSGNTEVDKIEPQSDKNTEAEPATPARQVLEEKPDAVNVNLAGEKKDEDEGSATGGASPATLPEKGAAKLRQLPDNLVSIGSPLSNGKVPYRVGLSRRHRIQPLLKIVKRKE